MEKASPRRIWALPLLAILLQVEVTSAANILAFFTFAGKSHNAIYGTITKALAEKGHQLTVFTSQLIELPPPNYHQIDVNDVVGHNFNIFNSTRKVGIIDLLGEISGLTDNVCRMLMEKKEVKALVKPKDGIKFDLILLSNFYGECLYPFAQIYNAPIVIISSMGPMPSTYSAIGNALLPSYFADPITGYFDRMTLKERMINTVVHIALSLCYKYYIQQKMENEMRKTFGEDTPSISKLEEYVSLAIINNHFSLNPARPTVPCLIEAGGLHIKAAKELPKDLNKFLNEAGEDGVIYFSLGSILKSSGLTPETRNAFVTAFSKVKQRVLWKWEGEHSIPGLSKNVHLKKWLPQLDVLAHPNIKLFISHGGLLSFQEAASRGVPLIGIPHFGDQIVTMNTVLHHKAGLQLDAQNLTASSILNAINEILENPIYSKNMKRLQSLVTDQMEHPLERTIYWIEYVMRHKGAKHLKPAAFYLHWSQIYMLDILFILVVMPLFLMVGIGLVSSKGFKRICRPKREKNTTKKTRCLMKNTGSEMLEMEIKILRTLWVSVFLSVLLLGEATSAANILAIFPLCSRSQNQVYTAITRALSQKGHNFTVITPQPLNTPPPNYRQIDVSDMVTLTRFKAFNVGNKIGFLDTFMGLREISVGVCREVLQKEEVKELAEARNGAKFDLILVSSFFSECYYPFARIYDAPIVLLSPGGPIGNTYVATGNAVLPSYFAEPLVGFNDRMSLGQRVVNFLAHCGLSLLYKHYFQRGLEHEMMEAFGKETPSISDLEEYVSLAVLNNHFSLNQARATVPCLIEAGGLHIQEPKELPQDLKAFLDGAGKEGAIYFSLGSSLRSSNFSDEIRDELINAFSQVKQRVLWKWEGDSPLPGKTENVRTEKWVPQQDVLAHPNIKLFITHGGLLSFQEAAHRGVPLIGIPFFGDQHLNLNRVLDLEVGVRLDSRNLTASNVLNAINQVLGNPEYSTNMKRLQSIVTDQKDHPLERAVYWIEYVMRHNGAKHLKPAAFYLHWSQICLLDVLFVLVVIPSSLTLTAILFISKVLKRFNKSKQNIKTKPHAKSEKKIKSKENIKSEEKVKYEEYANTKGRGNKSDKKTQ
ncbi:uncharacterized protein [Hetaerina americana]|uniref:uncharacterized protein n=1 Tax=Hetaerina americana TaxID=62018 RepID=UPI003A7F37AB